MIKQSTKCQVELARFLVTWLRLLRPSHFISASQVMPGVLIISTSMVPRSRAPFLASYRKYVEIWQNPIWGLKGSKGLFWPTLKMLKVWSDAFQEFVGTRLVAFRKVRVSHGTTELGYGTTNADAGVEIGLKRGDSEIWQKKTIYYPVRPLISRK